MRKILKYPTVIALAALASCGGSGQGDTYSGEATPTPGSMAEQISTSGKLHVTEYKVHKIVTANDLKQLEGTIFKHKYSLTLPVGDRKVAIPVDAVFKAYIDFGKVTPADIEVTASPRTVSVTLPQPEVELTSSKVDHKGIREYRNGLRSRFSDAELSEFERQGRAAIENAMPTEKIRAQARRNGADLLIPVLVKAGFPADSITIVYTDAPAENRGRTLKAPRP